MSITFSPEYTEQIVRIHCGCGDAMNEKFYASHSEAYQALIQGQVEHPHCEDEWCFAYFPTIRPVEESPMVNVSNFNALSVLEVLGFPVDGDIPEGGMHDAKDFLGRILMALAIQPEDEGTLPEQNGNVVSCGRPAGYIQSRLAELQEVASYAAERDLRIVWG